MVQNSGRNILVVAAHPDDEVLGCGGAIAKHTCSGDNVLILIAAEGATARQDKRNIEKMASELTELQSASLKAAEILGVKAVEHLGLPDNRLDSLDRLDIVKKIEEVVNRHQPCTVYFHHSGDVNIDHRRLHEAVITACRPIPGRSVKRLLSYEVASSTEWQTPNSGSLFQPNWFVDITETLARKIEALRSYPSELKEWPHPRSVEAVINMARYRGSQVGVHAAEAYCLLRKIS